MTSRGLIELKESKSHEKNVAFQSIKTKEKFA